MGLTLCTPTFDFDTFDTEKSKNREIYHGKSKIFVREWPSIGVEAFLRAFKGPRPVITRNQIHPGASGTPQIHPGAYRGNQLHLVASGCIWMRLDVHRLHMHAHPSWTCHAARRQSRHVQISPTRSPATFCKGAAG